MVEIGQDIEVFVEKVIVFDGDGTGSIGKVHVYIPSLPLGLGVDCEDVDDVVPGLRYLHIVIKF